MLKATRADRVQSEFEMVRSRFVSYLEEMFGKGLQSMQGQTFHEVLAFSDVASVRKNIVGAPRAAVHTALSNPVHYLQVCFKANGRKKFALKLIFCLSKVFYLDVGNINMPLRYVRTYV